MNNTDIEKMSKEIDDFFENASKEDIEALLERSNYEFYKDVGRKKYITPPTESVEDIYERLVDASQSCHPPIMDKRDFRQLLDDLLAATHPTPESEGVEEYLVTYKDTEIERFDYDRQSGMGPGHIQRSVLKKRMFDSRGEAMSYMEKSFVKGKSPKLYECQKIIGGQE